jgi:hypothetical protein
MVIVIRLPGRISSVKDLAAVKIEMIGHVQSKSRTCPVLLTGTWSGDQIYPFFRKLVWMVFLMICTSPTHPMYPP